MRRSDRFWSNHSPAARICSVVLLMICASLSLQGQTIFGRLSGTVRDKQGAVVPNAAVTVTNTATNLEHTATTDDGGFYTVTNLPVGNYKVLVEQKGFKRAVQADNVLTADARITVDITLTSPFGLVEHAGALSLRDKRLPSPENFMGGH